MADVVKKNEWSLWRRKHQLIQELAEIEEIINKERAQDRHIMKKADIKWTERHQMGMVSEGRRMAPVMSPRLGFDCHNFVVFMSERPPGENLGAYHTHGEAIKYYLSGSGVELIGDKKYEVEAGDVCFIPANTWHGTQNPNKEPLTFLAVVMDSLVIKPSFLLRDDVKEETPLP